MNTRFVSITIVTSFTGFSLRESVSGEKTLPSARAVANLLRNHLQKPPVTGVFGEWGHFIQRDSFSIPVRSGMGIAPVWAFRNIYFLSYFSMNT